MGILDNMYGEQVDDIQDLLNNQCDDDYELTIFDVKQFYLDGKIDFKRSMELQLETTEYKKLKGVFNNG